MVSVMLLTVSLLTVAVLVVRSSNRGVSQANALVARERALMAAQAAIELGAAQSSGHQRSGQSVRDHRSSVGRLQQRGRSERVQLGLSRLHSGRQR
jgi:hypothetical protein